jgi:hypothetical protein
MDSNADIKAASLALIAALKAAGVKSCTIEPKNSNVHRLMLRNGDSLFQCDIAPSEGDATQAVSVSAAV